MITKCVDPVTAGTVNRVRRDVGLRRPDSCRATLDSHPDARALRAELVDAHTIVCAGFATCSGSSPVLEFVRLLLARGADPRTALKIYRGDVLALNVRTIAEAARLRVAAHGVGFEVLSRCTAASPVRSPEKNHPAPLNETFRRCDECGCITSSEVCDCLPWAAA